jgi:hypothetical protein
VAILGAKHQYGHLLIALHGDYGRSFCHNNLYNFALILAKSKHNLLLICHTFKESYYSVRGFHDSDDIFGKKSCQEFSEAIGNNPEMKY